MIIKLRLAPEFKKILTNLNEDQMFLPFPLSTVRNSGVSELSSVWFIRSISCLLYTNKSPGQICIWGIIAILERRRSRNVSKATVSPA